MHPLLPIWAAAVTVAAPVATPVTVRPYDPEKDPARNRPEVKFEINQYERDAVVELPEIELPPAIRETEGVDLGPEQSLDYDLILEDQKAWGRAGALELAVRWPEGAPGDAQILVYVQDWEFRWYQNLLPGNLEPGRVTSFAVDFAPESTDWEAEGHHAPWHLRALAEPLRVGFRVFSRQDLTGVEPESKARVLPRPAEDRPPRITQVRVNQWAVPLYRKFEVTFSLPDRYLNPFDPDEIDVWAEITPPDGKPIRVDGFYTRDYVRQVASTGERIMPRGPGHWQVRYAPIQEGEHQWVLHARDAQGDHRYGPRNLTGHPADSSGYIRVSSRDPRFVEFDDGKPFFPIGYNIRSPFDTRYDVRFPWRERWPEGSQSYLRRFEAMSKSGANFVEIWSAAWSLGLEWIPLWAGYHGIGQYNLRHAWEMDRVMEEAEARNIFVNLVIHNHGKFSTFSDKEWRHNPFNAENGGPFEDPEDYVNTAYGRKMFRQLMRYMVARWGYSRNLYAWEFWSELNLTGSSRGFYRARRTVDWHRDMGRYVKEIDPNDHLITTHYSGDYNVQNMEISNLPEIDVCHVDAYHGDPESIHIIALLRATARHNNPLGKPVLVTEFGGTAHAGELEHMEEALHTGLWSSTVIPLAGTPLFWWWGLIEEMDWYDKFGTVARFMDGEDRRGAEPPEPLPVVKEDGQVVPAFQVLALGSRRRLLGWLYDTRAFGTRARIQEYGDLVLSLPWPHSDRPTVELWDTESGKPVSRLKVETEGGRIEVALPDLKRDLAFKVIR